MIIMRKVFSPPTWNPFISIRMQSFIKFRACSIIFITITIARFVIRTSITIWYRASNRICEWLWGRWCNTALCPGWRIFSWNWRFQSYRAAWVIREWRRRRRGYPMWIWWRWRSKPSASWRRRCNSTFPCGLKPVIISHSSVIAISIIYIIWMRSWFIVVWRWWRWWYWWAGMWRSYVRSSCLIVRTTTHYIRSTPV